MQIAKCKSFLTAIAAVLGSTFIGQASFADEKMLAPEALVVSSQSSDLDISIYGSRQAQVQEQRNLQLAAGRNQIRLDGVASAYRPDSLRIVEVSGPGKFSFRSATYRPANLTPDRLLAESIGKEIELYHQASGQTITGKLLSVSGSTLVVSNPDGSVRLVSSGDVRIAKAPAGLSNSAALVLDVEVSRGGSYKLTFMYDTAGLAWSAKHNVVFNDNTSRISNWQTLVSVSNNAGVDFKGATLRLMSGGAAGEGEGGGREIYTPKAASARTVDANDAVVESVGDQKSYVVPGKIDLENSQTRQIQLFAAADVPVRRSYFVPQWSGNEQQQSVSVKLTIDNCVRDNLGQPLPAGIVKIYQTGPSGVQQQTGSARMTDKSVDEVFDLVIGTASDIKFTRRLIDQKGGSGTRPVRPGGNLVLVDQNWEVKIFNYKNDRAVTVKVEVPLPQDQPVNQPLVKKSATLAEGELKVDKSSNGSFAYTVKTQVYE